MKSQTRTKPDPGTAPLRVSLLMLPEAFVSYLTGLYDVLTSFDLLATFDPRVPLREPFEVEIVGETTEVTETTNGLAFPTHRCIGDVATTDIVIVPALRVRDARWETGRYPRLVEWLRAMHDEGATLCSACSGALLLGETGLLDGLEATIHWAYAPTFAANFPTVRLRQEEVLVAAGDKGQFIMSGASAAWHDLVLYLVARHVGPAATQAISKFMMLQWHRDGQSPYTIFQEVIDHGDAEVLAAQEWLSENCSVASPVEEMTRRSGLTERTFKRRFRSATGLTPLVYVQHLRVEAAKRLLEQTETPIDEVAWRVGYEDASFFRRLFKRVVGLNPGAYRKKFQLPDFALG